MDWPCFGPVLQCGCHFTHLPQSNVCDLASSGCRSDGLWSWGVLGTIWNPGKKSSIKFSFELFISNWIHQKVRHEDNPTLIWESSSWNKTCTSWIDMDYGFEPTKMLSKWSDGWFQSHWIFWGHRCYFNGLKFWKALHPDYLVLSLLCSRYFKFQQIASLCCRCQFLDMVG